MVRSLDELLRLEDARQLRALSVEEYHALHAELARLDRRQELIRAAVGKLITQNKQADKWFETAPQYDQS